MPGPNKRPKEKNQRETSKHQERFEDEVIAESDRVIKMKVTWKDRAQFDALATPFLDHPMAAIRSPSVRVQANNLIRVSVLVQRPYATTPGVGGVIIRDTIGGEPFQFRSTDPIPGFSRVVLYRKAPADMKFSVMLGLAGYGEVVFDDFRIEVMEEDPRFAAPDPDLAAEPRRPAATPRLPDPRVPVQSARRPSDVRQPQR